MCFTSLYIYILDLFTPSLQFIFLFCFYEMLKKIEENNLFFFSMVLFLSNGIVLCLCCAQAVYYSSFTMLCIWPRRLCSAWAVQSKRFTNVQAPFWALVQMPCSIYSLFFNEKMGKKKEEKKKRVKVEAEEAGHEGAGLYTPTAKTPPQLLSPPHLTTLLDF